MGLGTVTLLGMLCTPGQVPADTTTWNTPTMKIPIDYNPGKRAEIKELLLYVSSDLGQTWQQYAVAVPERDTQFTFNAPADGVYWFNMVVVSKAGVRSPADVFKAQPALKVLFDTKKPVVTVTGAQRVGDDVTVSWKVTERNPDWSKFKLEYATDGATWTPVPTRPEADGSAQFKVAAAGNLSVRVALTDLAGHSAEAMSPVAGTTVATKPTVDPGIRTIGTGGTDLTVPPPIAPTGPAPGVAPPPERAKDILLPSEPRGMDTGLPPPPGTPGAPTIGIGESRSDPISVNTAAPSYLPAPQVINVTTFKMAYEVEDRGASGVGKAEVWVTRDEGRNWIKWTTIDKPDSPLVIDLAKHGPKDVEGIYGFRVLLQSGAGLGREAPKPGDAPDLRVAVDITPPVVCVYEPYPDRTQKDTMVLRWTAVDPNLAADPITLEWSDSPRGPWMPIAAADAPVAGAGVARRLPNTGSFAWKVPANFPAHKVYLKVTARDKAGNVTEVTSTEPVLVDMNKPAAVKLNIVGGSR
ncbi:MAG TPA: hypothetical protein VKD90_28405 [Gemmataceae bacterium]|nr:hypothetical protein [Gemmataceae bacterium]